MKPVCVRTGYLFVALIPAASFAADPTATCQDWQVKFHQVQASWAAPATTRAELERSFGVPTRSEPSGACTHLNYAVTGCACWFTVCSQGTVVSKTLTVGAAAAPVFLQEDPAELAEAMAELEQRLGEAQAEMARLRQALAESAPPPAPGEVRPPPPTAAARLVAPAPKPPARQCAALTRKGGRCSRRAAEGSQYCWQHRR